MAGSEVDYVACEEKDVVIGLGESFSERNVCVSAKGSVSECTEEVEEAKRKRLNANTFRNTASSVEQFRPILRNLSISEEKIEKFWMLEVSGLCNLV